jgi:cell division protein FtsZ
MEIVRFEPPEEKQNIIKVMGVGGGGSNAVTHMFSEGITGVDFVLCNTDDQALQRSPVENKLHIGKHALGAGNIPAVGRAAAEETEEKIHEILDDGTRMLFITAGMGGGTGTGAAPVVARISKEMGILTVGIVTLPFSFEGKRRQQQAVEGIQELRKYVDALLVISNDKLRQEYGNMKLTEAFKMADDVLKIAAKGIAEIITVTGYVNVDFEDVKNVMKSSGKAIMGSGYAKGEDRALKAVEEAVHSPLLDDSDITGAKNILVYITSGTEEVRLDEVTEINEYVQDATGKVSEVIWGNGEDMTLEDGIRVTLIATGFGNDDMKVEQPIIHTFEENKIKDPEKELQRQAVVIEEKQKDKTPQDVEIHSYVKKEEPIMKIEEVEEEKPQDEAPKIKRHTLYEDDEPLNGKGNNRNDESDIGITVHRITPDAQRNNEPIAPSPRRFDNPFRNDDDDVDVPGFRNMTGNQSATMMKVETKPAQAKQLDQKEILRRQRFMSFNTDPRSLAAIESMENIPAYARMEMKFDTETNELSDYSIDKETGLRENNSFLHDNVD